MIIIPAINETSFGKVEKKIIRAADFGAEIVHLDVSDGKFTANQLWNNPADLLKVKSEMLNVKIEVHLMVENPDEVINDWIDAGAKRIILHLEAMEGLSTNLTVVKIVDNCHKKGVELFLAINPDTQAERLFEYKNLADGFLILAVVPGKAGQKFNKNQLEKIKLLRQGAPDAKIEVDGGVNLENAAKLKNAGADILVSASAIWESSNPKEAYNQLISL